MPAKSLINIFIFLFIPLLSSLACQAAAELFAPGTRVEIAPLPTSTTVTLNPTQTAPLQTCPSVTDNILVAATGFIEGEPQDASGSDPDVVYLLTYSIAGDQIEPLYSDTVSADLLPYQQDQASHKQVWDFFVRLIPAGERSILSEYTIVNDGSGNLLAAVAQSAQDPERWVLEVDILDSADRLNLTYTLIHEYAHLLTLNPSQVTPSLPVFNNPDDEDIYLNEVSACPGYFPGEGCALPESYINQFYYRFWDDILAEWQDVNLIEDDDQYYAALDDFYYAHEDRFLTDYAATNPAEDIAEAFSFFVLSPRPTGNSMAEEKILFFYDYPELIHMREQIVNSICMLQP
jgi:hypothetical protein